MNIEDVPGNEHVKRAIHLAVCGDLSVCFIGKRWSVADTFYSVAREHIACDIWQSCPCGNYGDDISPCNCDVKDILGHRLKMPFSDIYITTAEPTADQILSHIKGKARIYYTQKMLDKVEPFEYERLSLSADAEKLFVTGINHLNLQFAHVDSLMNIASTIAKMDNSNIITPTYLAEAFQYKSFLSR